MKMGIAGVLAACLCILFAYGAWPLMTRTRDPEAIIFAIVKLAFILPLLGVVLGFVSLRLAKKWRSPISGSLPEAVAGHVLGRLAVSLSVLAFISLVYWHVLLTRSPRPDDLPIKSIRFIASGH